MSEQLKNEAVGKLKWKWWSKHKAQKNDQSDELKRKQKYLQVDTFQFNGELAVSGKDTSSNEGGISERLIPPFFF